jgi:hypothetical protein
MSSMLFVKPYAKYNTDNTLLSIVITSDTFHKLFKKKNAFFLIYIKITLVERF